uniref:Biosis of lysosomal organelles complex 1 subunit 4 n=1 Tax=Dromaius novaehollandiae TaxID=8790 RepID=A0A8C4PDW4_DRONO
MGAGNRRRPARSGMAAAAGSCAGGDSGNVSQSHSNASGLGEQEGEEGDASEASLSATAAAYSAYLLPDRAAFCTQIESLEKSLEDLLTRVDEFVGMLDMIRSDSSQVVNESIPQIYTKATEMRHIYRKIDKLEAFVKMIGNCVAGMEAHSRKSCTQSAYHPSLTRNKYLLLSPCEPTLPNRTSLKVDQSLLHMLKDLSSESLLQRRQLIW